MIQSTLRLVLVITRHRHLKKNNWRTWCLYMSLMISYVFVIGFVVRMCRYSLLFNSYYDHFDWLSQLYSEWRQTSKLVNLRISAKVRVCDFGKNLKMTKTSQFCSIHQENTCKSCLHSNLIILTDFHSFTVNEEKLQN